MSILAKEESPTKQDVEIISVEASPDDAEIREGLESGRYEIRVTDYEKQDGAPEGVKNDLAAAKEDLNKKSADGSLKNLPGIPSDATSASVIKIFDISIVDKIENTQVDHSLTKGTYTITLNLDLNPDTDYLYHFVDGNWEQVQYTVVSDGIQFTVHSLSAFAVIRINTKTETSAGTTDKKPSSNTTDTGVQSSAALFAGAGIAALLGIVILLKARRSVAK